MLAGITMQSEATPCALTTYILLGVPRNEDMQLLFLSIIILRISSCAFLDRPPTPDGNLGVGLLLHALLSIAPGTNDQPNEVIAGVVLLGDEDFAFLFTRSIVCWRSVARVCFYHLLNQEGPAVHEFLLVPYFSGVETLAILVIAWRWGWRSFTLWRDVELIVQDLSVDIIQLLLQVSDLGI